MFLRIVSKALIALALLAGGRAAACVYVGDMTNPPPTAAEREAEEKRVARIRMREGRLAAEKALLAGTDPAEALAEMLVPNVRPVLITYTSCGSTEIDHADDKEALPDPLAGTPLAGRGDEFAGMIREYHPGYIGGRCSTEFRGTFAAALRRRLTSAQLRESFVFIAARSERWDGTSGPLKRMMAFEGGSRAPPVRWAANWRHADAIRRWTRRDATGRSLQASLDAFWAEQRPLLSDNGHVCPATVAQWIADQAELVRMIEEQAARRRGGR